MVQFATFLNRQVAFLGAHQVRGNPAVVTLLALAAYIITFVLHRDEIYLWTSSLAHSRIQNDRPVTKKSQKLGSS